MTATRATGDDARSPLVMEADALVDAYAKVFERAHDVPGRIKPEEVRSLLPSAYIQLRQLNMCAVPGGYRITWTGMKSLSTPARSTTG
jgi:hypothetical protein